MLPGVAETVSGREDEGVDSLVEGVLDVSEPIELWLASISREPYSSYHLSHVLRFVDS